ncbi:MAG: GNAT family N-acetyltransferase [Acidimicrobiales bacterium]|jgi:predicted GNAT family N-acyltransferase
MVDHIVVTRVEPERTYRLRRDVLRPQLNVEDMVMFGDDGSDTGIYGAVIESTGELVGTANVRRDPPPEGLLDDVAPGTDPQCWRLRGMATRADLRSQGIGRRVLDACVGHVAERGGGFLWCNARVPAQQFYERAGFHPWGEEFESVGIAHVVMWRNVEAEENQA